MPKNKSQSKILIVTHSYPCFEGDWRANFIEKLAEAYSKNAEVSVFVPYVRTWKRTSNSKGIRLLTYKYMPVDSMHTIGVENIMKGDLRINFQNLLGLPFMLICGLISLTLLLRREKFDLIQAHWAVPNSILAVAARFLSGSKAKIMTSFPGSDVTVLTSLKFFGRFLAKIVNCSDYLSCNSSDLKDDLVTLGIPAERIDLVIYAVDHNAVQFAQDARDSIRKKHKISDDEIMLLMVGRFVPKKGFSLGLKALAQITESQKKIRMIVVGSGDLKPEYDQILEKDDTAQYVEFVGDIASDELRKYYCGCDVFLMPSQRLPSDGLNVVVLEAMACARPIVATNVGGNDLVVFPGENGFLHGEQEVEKLASSVNELIMDPDLRTKMGNKSLEFVREKFNWNSISEYYLSRFPI